MSGIKNISVCLIGDPPSERFTSMGIYESELSSRLRDMTGNKILRHHWPEAGRQPKNRYLAAMYGYWKRHLYYPSLLTTSSADIYHIMDHSYAHLLAKLPQKRTIVTCHDLMPLMVEGYGRTVGGKLAQASFRCSVSYLNKARHVIADSAATKNALVGILGLADNDVTVVPLGVDEIFCPGETALDQDEPRDSKYILQVGATAEPYKNTMNILRSFSWLKKRADNPIKLLKAGKPYTLEQQRYLENEDLIQHVRYLGFVERKELPKVYRKASVLIMPSLYEGFGMPLLEAMACGVPVITSRRGSIPEVAGDAAFYVDPDDPRDIAAALEKVLSDRAIRQDLIVSGQKRVKLFTWQRTARETMKVYHKAIDGI